MLDDHFPGICFLGKPHEVTVQSDPVTISPPGHGVSLKIPPNAIQSSDKPVNVSLQTCLSSSVFQYPEGCTPLSAVYHISSDMAFDKDVELTFEHFAELETDKQVNEMTFLGAEAQGEGKYIFVPMGSGEFKVGGHKCTISTRQFSFISAGSISSSEIRKMIALLYSSYSNDIIFLQGNDILYCSVILMRLKLLDMLLLLYLLMMLCISQYVIHCRIT